MSENSIETLGKSIDVRAITFEAFKTASKVLQKNTSVTINDNRVIIITNFGQIFCDVEDKESIGETIAQIVLKVRDKELEKLPSKTSVINECKTLLLKDVTIIPFSNPQVRLNYGMITLFTDQIVGLSIGSLPDANI
jgi:hypothetical protein